MPVVVDDCGAKCGAEIGKLLFRFNDRENLNPSSCATGVDFLILYQGSQLVPITAPPVAKLLACIR